MSNISCYPSCPCPASTAGSTLKGTEGPSAGAVCPLWQWHCWACSCLCGDGPQVRTVTTPDGAHGRTPRLHVPAPLVDGRRPVCKALAWLVSHNRMAEAGGGAPGRRGPATQMPGGAGALLRAAVMPPSPS